MRRCVSSRDRAVERAYHVIRSFAHARSCQSLSGNGRVKSRALWKRIAPSAVSIVTTQLIRARFASLLNYQLRIMSPVWLKSEPLASMTSI
jgi:hypothetical protein